MLISIVTPTFNSEKTIERNAISIVNQSYKHFEHIIIDNLSKDNTINIIKKVYEESKLSGNLKVFSEKDNGISEAFNKGIKQSKGEIIAILNSDDEYYYESVFEDAINAFMNEEILIVYGNIYFADMLHGSNIRYPFNDKINGGIQFIHPAMFIRREVYDKLGLYNEQFRISMDYEYYCRLARYYKDLRKRVIYLGDRPFVKMYAGGTSWNNELKSINEIKTALKEHGFWNPEGKKFYAARIIRTLIKKYMTMLHLNFPVKIWRKLKYGN